MTIICFSFSSTLGILSQHLQKWFTYAAMRTKEQQRFFLTFLAEVQNPSLATTWQRCGNNGVAGSQNGVKLRVEVKLRMNYGELILLIAGE